METKANVALDHWAALLTEHRVRFAAFNLSQHCPGAKGPPQKFGGASMTYTTGPGHLGIEFWGFLDYTYFSKDQPLFGWGGAPGSTTGDCRTYQSPPDCSHDISHGRDTLVRARAAANPPTNNVYATLECPANAFIDAITFAHFGTPSGTCNGTAFQLDRACDKDISGLIKTLCVGRSSCRIPASTTLFGTPCESAIGWWIAVEARCSSLTSFRQVSSDSLLVV